MYDATDINESELNSIFMEDELQEIYDAILAFNKRDYTIAKHYLDTHDENTVSDLNLKDKIYLLKYRMLTVSGDAETAKAVFDEILSEDFKRYYCN